MKRILCFSFIFLAPACATTQNQDLLGFNAEESYPETPRYERQRLPVLLFPHINSKGDLVDKTWIRVEDPR